MTLFCSLPQNTTGRDFVVGNSTFIDTGACFKDGHFTILDITNDRLYSDANA